MKSRAAHLIKMLNLQPHPEGGYFREIFRSAQSVQPDDGRGGRSAVTTTYFLLDAGSVSRWHRVQSDEVWHYYEGDTLELFRIDEDMTEYHRRLLGPVDDNAEPVQIVPAGCWQAARSTGIYTLVGCTVGPGFDYADFVLISDRPEEETAIRNRFSHLGTDFL